MALTVVKYVKDLCIVYDRGDLIQFVDIVCEEMTLVTSARVLVGSNYSNEIFKSYILSISTDKHFKYNDITIPRPYTESSRDFFTELFKMMYCTPYEDLPLHLHEDEFMMPVVKWRLTVGV